MQHRFCHVSVYRAQDDKTGILYSIPPRAPLDVETGSAGVMREYKCQGVDTKE